MFRKKLGSLVKNVGLGESDGRIRPGRPTHRWWDQALLTQRVTVDRKRWSSLVGGPNPSYGIGGHGIYSVKQG